MASGYCVLRMLVLVKLQNKFQSEILFLFHSYFLLLFYEVIQDSWYFYSMTSFSVSMNNTVQRTAQKKSVHFCQNARSKEQTYFLFCQF